MYSVSFWYVCLVIFAYLARVCFWVLHTSLNQLVSRVSHTAQFLSLRFTLAKVTTDAVQNNRNNRRRIDGRWVFWLKRGEEREATFGIDYQAGNSCSRVSDPLGRMASQHTPQYCCIRPQYGQSPRVWIQVRERILKVQKDCGSTRRPKLWNLYAFPWSSGERG